MIPNDYKTVYNPSLISSSNLAKSKEIDPNALENFKSKICCLDTTFDKNIQKIAEELSEIIPENLELEDLVNIVFEECRNDISILLNTISMMYPSFSLSSYDKIRRAIVEDKEHILTNSSLFAMLKEHGLDNDEEKLTACYDLAYRMNHPYIYRLSQTPVSTNDYTLNFLWVNLNPQDRIQNLAQNIFKEGLDSSENAECIKDPTALRLLEKSEQSLKNNDLENWEKIKKSFTYRISKWADANPHAEINLWYDSALVTQHAQQKTFEMMKSIAQTRGVDLKFRDIRQLPNLKGEILKSLHPGTPVYYRVDILKALIADYMISSPKEHAKYCIVSDIDVEPMSPQQMFDQRTLDYLSSNGYVFNRVGLHNFENSFFIFNREKDVLQKIHAKSIIQPIESTIRQQRRYGLDTRIRIHRENKLDSQCVYRRYNGFRLLINESNIYGNLPSSTLTVPRKVVKCPDSQFTCSGHISKDDYRKERFRFVGNSDIPVTKNGRNAFHCGEGYIEELVTWKPEPLWTKGT